MPRPNTRNQLRTALEDARRDAQSRDADARTAREAERVALAKAQETERKLKEAGEKIAELEITRDALIALIRKMKAAISPGAWLPMILGVGILGALLPMLLGKST